MSENDKFKLATYESKEEYHAREWLFRIMSTFLGHIQFVSTMNIILPRLIRLYTLLSYKGALEEYQTLNKDEKESFDKIVHEWSKAIAGKRNFSDFTIPDEKFAKLLLKLADGKTMEPLYIIAFRNMMLSHLISNFEDFIGKNLDIVYNLKPKALSSSKNFTYEEILRYETMEDLRHMMIKKEIDSVLNIGIEGIQDYFVHRKWLDFSKEPNWQRLIECFLRRNCIVHNNSIPNEDYIKKVKPTVKPSTLDVDEEYLAKVAELLQTYAISIKTFFEEKFLDLPPSVTKPENPP